MFGLPARKTFHGYAAATRWAPQWTVAYLVFQAGAPKLRAGSLTGGGQIYGREYGGMAQNLLMEYSNPLLAQMGSGQIVAYPPSLAALYGGASGTGS